MLKYEAIAKVGDTIKSFDFEPFPGRDDKFVIGKVVGVDRGTMGAKCFVIQVTEDSLWHEPDYTRVGTEILVPMEMLFDYDGRVTVVS